MNHHPVFSKFKGIKNEEDVDWCFDFLGVKTSRKFFSEDHIDMGCSGEYPDFNEEYLEWVDILESVVEAKGSYKMIELGAGWGRWASRAHAALKQMHPDIPGQFIAVEAEPTHFQWLKEHFRTNEVQYGRMVKAAVDVEPGRVGFHTGDPAEWYGQCIGGDTEVRAISIRTILKASGEIDLMDLDVQNHEYKILKASQDLLHNVKRIHIGTHSEEVEDGLRGMFMKMGWECRNDLSLFKTHTTLYGTAEFNDGIQTWIRPS